MRGLGVIGALSLLALTGCTTASDIASGASPTSANPSSPGPVEAVLDIPAYAACENGIEPDGALREAWRHRLTPVSAPAIVGGCVVVYARHGRDLAITALDPRTGETLWTDAATPSGVPPGVSLGVATVTSAAGHEYVAYLAPVQPATNFARLRVVNPADGQVVSEDSRVGDFATFPAPCTDGLDVCIDGFVDTSPDGTPTSYRLTLPGDQLESMPNGLAGGRTLSGGGLLDTGARDPDQLARVDGRTLLWSEPLADVFGTGATTDLGWAFSHDPQRDLFVGSVGNRRMLEDGHLYLGRTTTAAFDAGTGRRLWIARHTFFGCGGLLLLSRHPGAEEAPAYPVRCRYAGHLDVGTRNFSKVRVSIEGFDVETGETRWSFTVDPSKQVSPGAATLPRSRGTAVLVRGTAGTRVLDLDSGRTKAPTSRDVFLCPSGEVTYRGDVPFGTDGTHVVYRRVFSGVFEPCDRDTEATRKAPDRHVVASEGAHQGDSWALSTAHAVVGYRAGGS